MAYTKLHTSQNEPKRAKINQNKPKRDLKRAKKTQNKSNRDLKRPKMSKNNPKQAKTSQEEN